MDTYFRIETDEIPTDTWYSISLYKYSILTEVAKVIDTRVEKYLDEMTTIQMTNAKEKIVEKSLKNILSQGINVQSSNAILHYEPLNR